MKPVILFSLPRSGSTILCGLLSQHDDFKVIEGSLSIGISNAIRNVFYNNAKSKESKTQVELARLEYQLPRLTRMWTHLERQMGGFGTRAGAGETQIEVDRRK